VTFPSTPLKSLRLFAALGLLCLPSRAQQTPPPEKPAEKPSAPDAPAQIELLETRIRFESNGDSRKEVHTRVRINSELGVRQFSILSFNFNRSFEQIEIPQVHITHKSGGTADILPSAITDQPDPGVASAPAYQDVRIKSVRILGLAPADILEYRIITTTSRHALAPDFWIDHSFNRSGVVSQENFEIDLPSSRQIQLRVDPASPQPAIEKSGESDSARTLYQWRYEGHTPSSSLDGDAPAEADIVLTTFASWDALSKRLVERLRPSAEASKAVSDKAVEVAGSVSQRDAKIEAIYNFVSRKIATVDLPVGVAGFRTRSPAQILSSGYGMREDKFALFYALAYSFNLSVDAGFTGTQSHLSKQLPRPSVLASLFVLTPLGSTTSVEHDQTSVCAHCAKGYWLAPDVEVAPFGMIPASQRGKEALMVGDNIGNRPFRIIPNELPFPSRQTVRIDATLAVECTLNAKVKYSMRGDNELLLRVAFHQSSRDKWKEVAQLLALSDGFRGKIVSASASDPSATKQPFTVEYEITQPQFVDWSKKPVRIPALLPQLGVPELPSKPESGAASTPIDLGTPLDVDTRLTLHLPPGTSVEVPTGTVVDRDYATFASRYSTQNAVVSASRHINFLHRQVPADRTSDYAAFLHAVQTDQSQHFTLTRSESPAQHPSTPKPNQAKPTSKP
jgi:Domain of Unknown Function with PDB structure (DUF3857)